MALRTLAARMRTPAAAAAVRLSQAPRVSPPAGAGPRFFTSFEGRPTYGTKDVKMLYREAFTGIVAPVMQIMPELQEVSVSLASCVLADSHVSSEQLEANSPKRLDVALEVIPPPPTHNFDVLLAKELCDLLTKVEVACPGSGRAIACLLTGTKTKGSNKKKGDCSRSGIPKKSLRCKGKNSAAA